MNRMKLCLFALAAAFTVSGCYSTTIRNGQAPGTVPLESDEHWHSGVGMGVKEISGPYDLDEICPEGWAEIETETDFFNGLVQYATFQIYNPQTVTVRCAVTQEEARAGKAPAKL
jgi:hypothetical protein